MAPRQVGQVSACLPSCRRAASLRGRASRSGMGRVWAIPTTRPPLMPRR